MPFQIRDVREYELDLVVALNNSAGPSILPMDAEKARFFWEHADYFRVIEQDDAITGFLVGFSDLAPHDSPNFRWFRERHRNFLYIDRIVIAAARRGGGRGRAFYADAMSFAEPRWAHLCCEVFLGVGYDPALLFHGAFGFREVGQQTMEGTGLRACMLMKDLGSHDWIATTYGGALPDEPWLAPRRGPARPAIARNTGT
ncbi:GNAT family N-acetyltransferase [Silanimonas sp.]|uniref:GNAT family N-acetyltransferase n=1 Tax=Silanimonas sp. TaxID=1929290 RepID=UPI0022C51604|nr:GNAT family N-acetyltransferase [Silanimonas sp.]MCZ8165407.1 GNAT family N-acetyltransferase [Silanimonas sp.]